MNSLNNEVFVLDDMEINYTESYTYLGVILYVQPGLSTSDLPTYEGQTTTH